jgi:hypothetical protein
VDANKNVLEFPRRTITGINVFGGNIYFTDGFREPKRINILQSKLGTSDHTQHTQLIAEGIPGALGDIKEENVTVIRKKPNIAPKFTINEELSDGESSLFDKTFFRLAYRYKYSDGQYSAIGPFTQVIFNANFPKDINLKNYFSSKEGYNKAMTNSIKSIDVFDFIPDNIPVDVNQVDILYKQENSSIIYSIANIKIVDPEWSAQGSQPNYEFPSLQTIYKPHKGKYTIVSENVKSALPADQLIRPWDNVPKAALAQEISGNRLIYGNYKQGYDLIFPPKIYADYETRSFKGSYSEGGIESIKSQRDYQIGVVFSDKYGRETPVLTNEEGSVRVPWRGDSNEGVSSITPVSFTAYLENTPSWAEYCKFFVKQTSGEYYNLSMYKAYNPQTFKGYDNKDTTNWISFASADRNKIKEDDYIILKSTSKGGEPEAIYTQNKYRVLDIKNEAPDAIRKKFYTSGKCVQDLDTLFSNPNFSITNQTGSIEIDRNTWLSGSGYTNTDVLNVDTSGAGDVDSFALTNEDIYISWTNTSSTPSETSSRYRVISAKYGGAKYTLTLEEDITQADASIASSDGTSDGTASPTSDLIFRVESKKDDVDEDFAGKFFVQIAVDSVFNDSIYSASNYSLEQDTYTSAFQNIFYIVNPSSTNGNSNLTKIVNVENHPQGDSNPSTISEEETDWNSLGEKFFFVDGTYMAAAQTSNTKYAKYSKQGWIGEWDGPHNGVNPYLFLVFILDIILLIGKRKTVLGKGIVGLTIITTMIMVELLAGVSTVYLLLLLQMIAM